MKKLTTARSLTLVSGVAALAMAIPAHAQFGGVVPSTQPNRLMPSFRLYNEDKGTCRPGQSR